MNNDFLPSTYEQPTQNTCLTINTDASHCHQTLAAGYAFWVVCDQFVYKYANAFMDICGNSTDAEIKCIANALDVLVRHPKLPKVKFLIVNTDSKEAISHINNPSTPTAKIAAEVLDQLIKATGAEKFEFRHVKAHSGKGDARSHVNEWCDTHAKKFMILKRNELNKAKK